MEIAILAREFGLRVNPGQLRSGDDLGELAVALALEVEDDPHIDLLRDLSAAGVTIFIQCEEGQEGVVESGVDLLDINSTVAPPGYAGKVYDPEGLRKWCSDQAYVVDSGGAVQLIRAEMLISQRPPRRPGVFRRVIEVTWDPDAPPQAPVLDISSGVDRAKVRSVGVTPSRFYGDVTNLLAKLAARVGPPRPTIVLPRISAGRVTTLQEEVKFLDTYLAWQLWGYQPPAGQVPGGIMQILLSACEERVEVSTTARAGLRRIIAEYVRKSEPIPISITLALGIVVNNPLKFLQWQNLPTYGWVYLAWWFRVLNEKVQRIFEPGIKLCVFEEGIVFGPWLDISEEEVARCLQATEVINQAIGAPIVSYPMLPEHFPPEVERLEGVGVTDEEIYAIVCSHPRMDDREVIAPLYRFRDRSYLQMQRLAGGIWDEAAEFALRKNRYLAWRKKAGLFERLSGHDSLLDAAITDKVHRLSLDITSPAMWNHGMPVMVREDSGKFTVWIVPEYRIADEFPKARRILISPKDFGLQGEPYVFYYLIGE